MTRRLLFWLHVFAVLTAAAGCQGVVRRYTSSSPSLPPQATIEDVARLINDNTANIATLNTSRARVKVSGLPSLKAHVAYRRPRGFRLQVEAPLGLGGSEVDLGSNDELFWFWTRRGKPPALFYCRHDQFISSRAQSVVPFQPEWIVEALGLLTFSARDQHVGPVRQGDRLEVKTFRQTPAGRYAKITRIDATRGWVLEQQLYDPQGNLLISALARKHRRDPLMEVTLPEEVEIRWPALKLHATIEMPQWRVNAPKGDPRRLFEMPTIRGIQAIDLSRHAPPPSRLLAAGR